MSFGSYRGSVVFKKIKDRHHSMQSLKGIFFFSENFFE